MEIFKHFNETQNVYMELTHRIHGGEGWDFGSVLWSPAYGKRRDTWGIMRDVKANDIIIHSLKGEHGHARTIDGISLVQQSYYVTEIAPPIIAKTWESDKYYRIPLRNYQPISKKLYVIDFLKEYDSQLKALGSTHSFYEQGRYRCAQKYLAKIPHEVLILLLEYFEKHDISLEHSEIEEGFPLNSCNSSINRAVTFFIIGRGNEKATVLSSVFCVWIHSLKQLKLR